MLKAEEKLRGQYRIEKVMKKGAGAAGPFFLLKFLPNSAGRNYFAFIISKKIDGRAVIRNKLKRQLQTAFRLQKNTLPNEPGHDIVVIAFKRALEASSSALLAAVAKSLKKII